ncbi:low molecular weight protein arginine phosphatase [Natranaerofaba carboxydovora]|uniref:low molecular weight protein arginine phosphatase n=1 Tax=Natranaerofaba carboxydovora TaxID=2742683 RepID=UPI001F1374BB|nr:low molecular weight protein arginine phosphatase [Natranaerofaba carboxydovora]UMZ75119.1 Protein-arginine-phosphatase [Natranaerofaba carboxydovora]
MKPNDKLNILFVCTGNTCRSCIAEDIFRRKIDELGIKENFKVFSAGIFAFEGSSASEQAKEVVEKNGGDLSSHASRQLKPDMIEKADYVFTMTLSHKEGVIQMMPEASDKIYTLKEFVEEESADLDIVDPFGKAIEIYEKTYKEIESAIEKLLELIIKN